jgi:hypothetical protein
MNDIIDKYISFITNPGAHSTALRTFELSIVNNFLSIQQKKEKQMVVSLKKEQIDKLKQYFLYLFRLHKDYEQKGYSLEGSFAN